MKEIRAQPRTSEVIQINQICAHQQRRSKAQAAAQIGGYGARRHCGLVTERDAVGLHFAILELAAAPPDRPIFDSAAGDAQARNAEAGLAAAAGLRFLPGR
jgi:hypothetical protein